MCSGSEAGSYLRLIDVVYHSTLGLRVIKKKKKDGGVRVDAGKETSLVADWTELEGSRVQGLGFMAWGLGFRV